MRLFRNPEVKGILGLMTVALALGVLFLAVSGTLTDWTGIKFTLKKPLTNSIVFVSDRNGHSDVWAMDMDGSNQRPLTKDSSIKSQPVVTPDGYSIVFVAKRASDYSQLYAIAPDGSNLRQITSVTGSKSAPKFSADGKEIVFLCTGDVWRVGARGDNPGKLLPPDGHGRAPGVSDEKTPYLWSGKSADGSIIAAVQSHADMQLALWKGPADEEPVPIIDESERGRMILSGERVNAAWSNSRSSLAVTLTDRKGDGVIVVADAENGSITPLLKTNAIGSPAWSPDDSSIALELLERTKNGDYKSVGLAVVDASGENPRVLVEEAAANPIWSPDGTRILFTHNKDIFSVDVETGKTTNLTNGKGSNTDPSWAPVVSKQ